MSLKNSFLFTLTFQALLLAFPITTLAQYEGWTEGQLNQALSDAEREVGVCERSIETANANIETLEGNIAGGTAEPDYVKEKIQWAEDERTRLYNCIVKQRKIIGAIQGELSKRMKEFAGTSEREKWQTIRKRADRAMQQTIKTRTKLNQFRLRTVSITAAIKG